MRGFLTLIPEPCDCDPRWQAEGEATFGAAYSPHTPLGPARPFPAHPTWGTQDPAAEVSSKGRGKHDSHRTRSAPGKGIGSPEACSPATPCWSLLRASARASNQPKPPSPQVPSTSQATPSRVSLPHTRI